jgi:hypothetical protein
MQVIGFLLHRLAASGVLLSLVSAGPPDPASTPGTFTTDNYNLSARIPARLFHCPYPEGWVGSDHGISIYLVKPKACSPDGPAAADAEAARLPRIQLFYAYNNADSVTGPGDEARPFRTNAELVANDCRPPASRLPGGLTLLGLPAAGCVHRHGTAVSVFTATVYSQDPGSAPDEPDSYLFVSLETTSRRYLGDLKTLRALVAGMRVCIGSDQPPCPPFIQW